MRRRVGALVFTLAALLAVPFVLQGTAGAGPSAPQLAASTCDGGTYTVVRNDGWSKIAAKLGVSMSALLAANNATTASWLYPGDVLCLPTGAMSTSSSAPASTAVTTTTSASTPTSSTVASTGPVTIRQFPVQGVCFFVDTWGAPRSGGRQHQGVDIIAKTGKDKLPQSGSILIGTDGPFHNVLKIRPPMPFDDGIEPYFDSDLKWIGDASALITMLGDLTLMAEAQVAINGLSNSHQRAIKQAHRTSRAGCFGEPGCLRQGNRHRS